MLLFEDIGLEVKTGNDYWLWLAKEYHKQAFSKIWFSYMQTDFPVLNQDNGLFYMQTCEVRVLNC